MDPRFERALHQLCRQLLRENPNAVAITVSGSVARGDAEPYSDIDVLVIIRSGKPAQAHRFVQGILAGVSVRPWRAYRQRQLGALADQAYWLRKQAYRILYDRTGRLHRLLTRARRRRITIRVHEDNLFHAYFNLVEYYCKVLNGYRRRDALLVGYAANVVAQQAGYIVTILNRLQLLSENTMHHQILAASERPPHFAQDYPVALGYTPSSMPAVYRAAIRLATESRTFLRLHRPRAARRNAWLERLLAHPLPSLRGQ